MTQDIYQALRERLDQYSIGFPSTSTGVELKILRKMFTEIEAATYLQLTLLLESVDTLATRCGQPRKDMADILEGMADRGLIFRRRKNGEVKFAAVPFVVGSYEFQLGRMNREFAELFEQYFNEAFHEGMADSFMRPIPVNRSVPVNYPIATYEDARHILKQQKLITVINCICRVQQGLIDQGCDKPLEVCLAFGSHGQYYLDRGLGRQVTPEEALAILDQAEAAGLVNQPYNSQNPGGMCNCCGDCCGILRALNRASNPAELVISNYQAVMADDLCVGCEICLQRCQMAAITMTDTGVAQVNRQRCLGCGLCVTTCPSGALQLEAKAPADQRRPPATSAELMQRMAVQRGKVLLK